MPASPYWRGIERIAHTDRMSIGCRFGEPCNPRKLVALYDVGGILETYEDYESYYGSSMDGAFDNLQRWSGVLVSMPYGDHLMLINPNHGLSRRTLTITHEFGHLACTHEPIGIDSEDGMPQARFSDEQELEAYAYGLAVLLPYAPIVQMLKQKATIPGIAHHYGVSVQAVEMRLKLTNLWNMRARDGR